MKIKKNRSKVCFFFKYLSIDSKKLLDIQLIEVIVDLHRLLNAHLAQIQKFLFNK